MDCHYFKASKILLSGTSVGKFALFAGGYTDSGASNVVDIWNSENNTWMDIWYNSTTQSWVNGTVYDPLIEEPPIGVIIGAIIAISVLSVVVIVILVIYQRKQRQNNSNNVF
jgi:hypothetical protein